MNIIVIDNTPIREETLAAYRAVADELAQMQKELALFNDADQPAYRTWFQEVFGETLKHIQDVSLEVYKKQSLIEAVMREASLRGIGFHAAYKNVMTGNTWDAERAERERIEDAEAEAASDHAARELFEEFLKADGIDPDTLDQEDYEIQFARFKRELDGEESEPDSEDGSNDGRSSFFDREDLEDRLDSHRPQAAPSARSVRIKDLFRRLALKLHPDVADADADHSRLRALWLQVVQAKECGDLERLERIWASFSAGAEDLASWVAKAPISEIRERVRELFDTIRAMQKRMRSVKRDRAWGFGRPGRAKKVRRTRASIDRELSEELAELQDVLSTLDHFLEASLGITEAA